MRFEMPAVAVAKCGEPTMNPNLAKYLQGVQCPGAALAGGRWASTVNAKGGEQRTR